MSESRVAAVVLNWRDVENTVGCVESLMAEPLLRAIIVVDNESDGTLASALSSEVGPRVHVVSEPRNLGFAGGVNIGLQAALDDGASHVLVINNDARLRAGALESMLAAANADPEVGLVGPTVLNPDGSTQASGAKISFPLRIDEQAWPGDIDFVTWACVLVSRRALEAVGLLDDGFFMYWEDVDYGLRLRGAGFKLAIAPNAEVSHAVSSSHTIAGERVQQYSAFGLGRFGAKHPSYRTASAIRGVLRVVKRIAKGNPRAGFAVGRAFQSGTSLNAQPAVDVVHAAGWPTTPARPSVPVKRPSVDPRPIARYYRGARTAHLERLHDMAPGDFFYQKAMYDFDLTRAPSSARVEQAGLRRIVTFILQGTYRSLEIVEPYAPSALPQNLVISAAARLARLFRKHPTELVTYAIENAYLPAKLSESLRLPTRLAHLGLRLTVGFCYSTLSRIVFGTQDAADNYARLLGQKRLDRVPPTSTVIWGLSRPSSLQSVTRAADGPHRVVFLGTFDDRKGLPQLMRAWDRINVDGSHVLSILGKGPKEDEVAHWASSRPSVSVVVDPDRDKIWETLHRSDVLVLLSQPSKNWKEQIGLPILEGLSAGLEIVASSETGIAAWLREQGHAVLAPQSSAEELAETLRRVTSTRRPGPSIVAALPDVDGRIEADEWLNDSSAIHEPASHSDEHQRTPSTLESPRVLLSVRQPGPADNPYISLLVAALRETAGTQVSYFTWRRAFLSRYDVFHVQWPESLTRGRNALRRVVAIFLTAGLIVKLRLSRTPVVRTAHNLRPHERGLPGEQLLLNQIDKLTAVTISLNSVTPPVASSRSVLIPHGHYRDWYTPAATAQRSVHPVITYFGLVRDYKQVDKLAEAFSQATHLADASLRILGNPGPAGVGSDLAAAIAADPRIDADLRHIPDDVLATALVESTLVVLPYRNLHNSGAVLLALSFNVPVLLPTNDVTRELQNEFGAHFVKLFDGDLTPAALERAVEEVREHAPDLQVDMTSREWATSAAEHAVVYQEVVR